jgi:hypothetical protein
VIRRTASTTPKGDRSAIRRRRLRHRRRAIQTDFRTPNDHTLEETFKITLRNHKDEAVDVRVVEHLFRWSEWRILESNADYTKMDSSTIEFQARVAANGEKTLTYTVRYTWP